MAGCPSNCVNGAVDGGPQSANRHGQWYKPEAERCWALGGEWFQAATYLSHAYFSLFDGSDRATLEHWDGVEDSNAKRDLALVLLGGGAALAPVAARALATHPDRVQTAQLVEDRLSEINHPLQG